MFHFKKALFVIFYFAVGYTNAQNSADTIFAKDNILIPLPTISINFGISNLYSDVRLEENGPSPFRQFGYQITLTQRATKFLNASLNIYAGTVYGEEQRDQTNLNFKTSIFSQQLNIEYNFYPLIKPKPDGRQLINPYVGFGVGVISFRSKGDLKDSNGRAYQYWADGSINAEAEGTITPSEATVLERDFEYETDLRDANLDGLRKYSQTAFSLPINAGIRFQITKNVGINAAFTYGLNFSDLLDNVSEAGMNNRQGSSGFDNHLFTSVGLSVFLGHTKPSAKPQRLKPLLADTKSAYAIETEDTITVLESDTKTSEPKSTEQEPYDSINRDSQTLTLIQERGKMVSDAQQTMNKHLKEVSSLNKAVIESPELKKETAKEIEAFTQKFTSSQTQISELIDTKSIAKYAGEEINENSLMLEQDASQLKKIESKAEALEVLVKLNSGITEISSNLDEESIFLKRQEKGLNQLSVVKGKLRLIEKMSSGKAKSTSMSSEELSKTAESLNRELEELKADSSLNSIIEVTELAELASRVNDVQVAIESNVKQQDSIAKTDSENSSSDSNQNNSTKTNTHSLSDIKNTPPKEPGRFMWADIDASGWISPDEVLHFIDLLFEGEAVRTVDDIQNLIDYYFDQE